MACSITSGYTLDCKDNVGGIKTIYITELGNKSSITSASGVITAFSLTSGNKFWTYQLEKETATMKDDQKLNVQNGTLYNEQEVTFTIRKMAASIKNQLRLIAQNDVMVIVLDRNGIYWLLGEANGLNMTANTAESGTAFGDFTGQKITLSGKEETYAKQVTSSLMTTLTVAAP